MNDQPDYLDHIAHAGRQGTLKVYADQCITKYQRGILTLEDLVRALEDIVRDYDEEA